MKKYVKPELFYEQFELSKHIAACALDMTDKDTNNCYAVPDASLGMGAFGQVFNNGVEGCEGTPEDYCYEIAASGANTFNS